MARTHYIYTQPQELQILLLRKETFQVANVCYWQSCSKNEDVNALNRLC
jgi:hypothetical protein